MKARNIFGMALLAAAFILAARPALAALEIGYINDFQKSLDKFVPGSALDMCVTKGVLRLNFEKPVSGLKQYNGYAELNNGCGYPVWMMANLTGTGNNLLIEFDAKSVENCLGCIPLVYVGTGVPKVISQFKADYTGLEMTWQKHLVKASIAPVGDAAAGKLAGGTIVAISFTSLDEGLMRVQQQIGIDNLRITLDSDAPPPADK